ncbi:metallopeptidase TldD-related protein [Lapillicoccus jejuensis]|uniref:Putative Zn-dependent protease n=1 Tax=Lapillicoccus jejuensis TaxID=402171 RepID=A0A542E2A2_9MICO|nr:metallopeptidase TldD-related protein [Lapillicoccus jejuensis]TQJ09471.1 putative Zn-dependent protease [Lapillicoccus jejuensis]
MGAVTGGLSSPQEVVERALAAATSLGTVVLVTDRSEANLRWGDSSLTTNGEMSSRTVTVVATAGVSGGTASGVVGRTVVDAADVVALVAEAEAAARASGPAPDEAPLVTPAQAGTGSDFALEPEATSIGAFAGLAADLGEVFARSAAPGSDEVARRHFGFAEQIVDTTYLGSSTGLRLRHVQPTGRLEMNAKNEDWSASSYLGFSLRDPSEADALGADAQLAQRLGWARRTVEVPAGRYETVLPGTCLADLLVYLQWSMGARAADEGRSAFARTGGGTRVGEQVAQLPLDLYSDPTYDGLQSAPFLIAPASGATESVFDNGLAVGRTDWLRGGAVATLTGSRAYAARSAAAGGDGTGAAAAGTPCAPPGDNLVLELPGATGSLEDLVASTSRGLLVGTFWYIRMVDPQTLLMTGLTRDGVYLVEGGEVVGAVTNFRWNESPLDVLGRITEVGATQRCYPREWGDYFTRAAVPPVRVEGFNMSSVSQAQ